MTTMTKNDTGTTIKGMRKAPTGKVSVTAIALPVSKGIVNIDGIHVGISGRTVSQPSEITGWPTGTAENGRYTNPSLKLSLVKPVEGDVPSGKAKATFSNIRVLTNGGIIVEDGIKTAIVLGIVYYAGANYVAAYKARGERAMEKVSGLKVGQYFGGFGKPVGTYTALKTGKVYPAFSVSNLTVKKAVA